MEDFKTDTFGVTSDVSRRIMNVMGQVHGDLVKRNLGLGLPYPEAIEDSSVLDLGSGTGRDAFVLSKLVGAKGRVLGVERNQEQLDVANKYIDYHTKLFGYDSPNIEFKKGNLEDLKAAGISENSLDVIVFNCVINLCEDKGAALTAARDVLKNGGEIFFSDIYSNQPIPERAQNDKEASASLCGAVYWKDLHKMCTEMGFSRPVLVLSKCFPLKDERIEKLAAGIHFVCAIYRIFKIDQKAIAESGKPSKVTYKGSIVDHEESFKFAQGITFPTGTAIHVDDHLSAMLKMSRFEKHFDFEPSEDVNQSFVQVQETDPFSCAKPA
jgi:arsenite methyltransferase